ncbi:MAG: MarR family transcriptional regulator [Propionicimonas sp.]|nr:MarR family transcriptional regulator [Propionicimonas sp.]
MQPRARTGDPDRDRLLEELFALHDRMRLLGIELFGPVQLPPDLTVQQLRVMGEVAHEPGLSGHRLGERMGVSAPTASGLVDRLVDKGLLERVEDAIDRRVRRVYLTARGNQVAGRVDSLLARMLDSVVPPIPTGDLVVLKQAAEVLVRAVEHAIADQRGAELPREDPSVSHSGQLSMAHRPRPSQLSHDTPTTRREQPEPVESLASDPL